MEDERDKSLVPEFGNNLKDNENAGDNQKSGNGNQLTDNLKDKAKDKAKEKGKEAAKKAAKKAAKEGAKKGAAKVAMGPVIFWCTIIIVVIIILIGIIMFFATMPGMVMEQLKSLFKNLGNYIAAFFGADITEQVDDKQIFESLDYLEDLGYDLKGFGYLTNYYTKADEAEIEKLLTDKQKEDGYRIDEENGVVRDSEENIILAHSDFLFTYLASENYAYTLKNKNLSTQSGSGGGLLGIAKSIWNGAKTFTAKAFHFVGLDNLTQNIFRVFGVSVSTPYDQWGKGFLAIYDENGSLANDGTLFRWDAIKVDIPRRVLSIQRRSLFNNNNALEFSLDGWTGRYSMPVDLLLSIHHATMMPDLAYDMATTFDTTANIYLHKAEGEVIAAYRTANGEYITYGELNSQINQGDGRSLFSRILSWFDSLDTSDQEMQIASKLGIRHAPNCQCKGSPIYEKRIKNAAGEERYVIQDEDGKYYYYDIDIETINKRTETQSYKDVLAKLSKYKKEVINTDELYDVQVGQAEYKEFCDQCKTYLATLIDMLKSYNDYDFNYYIPYLRNVKNHWYRDVYFIADPDQEFVTIDTDYESVYRERWTLYKTYDKSDTTEYAKTHQDEFKLYLLDEVTGDYENSLNFTSFSTEVRDKLVEETVDGEKRYRFEGSSVEAEELKIKVAKIAVMTSGDGLKDYGWVQKENGEWSAYRFASSYKDDYYSPAYGQKDYEKAREEENGTVKESIMKNIYGKMNSNADVIQVGEGMRTETNPTIKKMFLTNTYFRYDGTPNTAEIITELRNKIGEEINTNRTDAWYYIEDAAKPYGALNQLKDVKNVSHDYTNKEYSLTIDGETDTYNVSDYSGQVVLNQDSLNAFSMLENTHTLDADYIYRDFKELVVELGYFAKEELTDEIPAILAFPVDGIGTYLYPDRAIDKRENEYGTMVHSSEDIFANIEISKSEESSAEANSKGIGDENPDLEDILYNGYEGNEAVVSPVTGILLEYGVYDDTTVSSITNEPYRVNVDLKYGPTGINKSDEAEDFESQIVIDKVGYAKILVLDPENFVKLQNNTANSWKNTNELYDVETGSFNEILKSDRTSKADEKLNNLSDIDKTIYGYKEFAELYEKSGIAGYVVVIDGFLCEKPNNNGSIITMDDFKDNNNVESRYIPEEENKKLASVSGTEKLKAEDKSKSLAQTSLYLSDVDGEELIFIKEGTVLGRTMTNDELKSGMGVRENPTQVKYDLGIVGNYIRVILRDLDQTPVEDVEDYFKRDKIDARENIERASD